MWLLLIVLSYSYQEIVKQDLIWPVASKRITSEFGLRRDPFTGRWTSHNGIDIGIPTGTSVRAMASGTVKFAGWKNRGMGYTVVIDHGNGLTTRYGHLSNVKVRKGKWVKRGKVIAYSGSTGRSTGPHLYYEVRKNGKAQDPIRYLRDEVQIASRKRPSQKESQSSWKELKKDEIVYAERNKVIIVKVPKEAEPLHKGSITHWSKGPIYVQKREPETEEEDGGGIILVERY